MESDAALKALTWRLERQARGTDAQAPPVGFLRLLGTLERRLVEALDTSPGKLSDSPPHIRSAFRVARQALLALRDGAGDPLSAREYNRRLNVLERAARVSLVRSWPLRCYVELTTRCNLRCPICSQSHFLTPERPEMTRADIALLAPALAWMDEVSVFGFGESLMVDFLDNLLDAVPPVAQSILNTNGILLTPERSRMLIEGGLGICRVSLDATDRQTYRLIRGADRLVEVRENIRRLVALRRSMGSQTPEVHLGCVLMRSNVAQLPDYIRQAAEMGVSTVVATYLTVLSEEFRAESLYYSPHLVDEWFPRARRAAREYGLALVLPEPISGKGDAHSAHAECRDPWDFIYFRADGGVAPCCIYGSAIGSWREEPFHALWNGAAYRRLRRTIHTPDQPGPCRACAHACFRDVRRETSHIMI